MKRIRAFLTASTVTQIVGLALIGAGVGLAVGPAEALVTVGALLYLPATVGDFVHPRRADG